MWREWRRWTWLEIESWLLRGYIDRLLVYVEERFMKRQQRMKNGRKEEKEKKKVRREEARAYLYEDELCESVREC